MLAIQRSRSVKPLKAVFITVVWTAIVSALLIELWALENFMWVARGFWG